jgi:hypothetical protein
VSAAVPTIAFSGVTAVQREVWELVESLAPAYGRHWWYAGLLAFVRQDQGRYDDAAGLADRALDVQPSSGHAVHARTHVYYETGQHTQGLRWLDPWITVCGRQASHRAHFAWHAALHELAAGDVEAMRRRYVTQLAPPAVTGVRALVDSASLLWPAGRRGLARRAPYRGRPRGRGQHLVHPPGVTLHRDARSRRACRGRLTSTRSACWVRTSGRVPTKPSVR